MKNIICKSILKHLKTAVFCILPLFPVKVYAKVLATAVSLNSSSREILTVVAIDESKSFCNFRKLDTAYIATVCRQIISKGGLVAVYLIGEPTDQTGLRCYLKGLPEFDNGLVLSKQADLRRKMNVLIAENKKKVDMFLKKIQEQIFAPMNDPKRKVVNTDINGFFKKVMILLDEPVNLNMKKYVFCYTDGIQSLNGNDSPACFSVKPRGDFILCLSGWKTRLPCDSIETKKFEDPEGFLQFLNANN